MKVNVCPVFNSRDFSHDKTSFGYSPYLPKLICNNCGYSGPMNEIEKEKAAKLKIKKKKLKFI